MLTGVILVMLVAIAVGLVRGGSFRNLAQLKLAVWPLVMFGLAAQVFAAYGTRKFELPRAVFVVGMLVSALLVLVFVIRNRWLPGMFLVAIGFVLNALVVTANAGMPVSLAAVVRADIGSEESFSSDAKHIPLTGHSKLPWLADVIPLPMPGGIGANVLSVGDLCLAAGIGVLVCSGMLRPGTGRRARQFARGRLTEL